MPRKTIHTKKKPSSQVNGVSELLHDTRNRSKSIDGEESKNRSEDQRLLQNLRRN